MIKKLLIIPDAHAKPEVSNERFSWLGNFIAEEQPEVIVSIGDFADMPSLSLFDLGKRTYEGRRYVKDVDVCHDALQRIQDGIDDLNKELRAKKTKQYNPKRYITLGNHCNRINKATNSDAKLDGTIGIRDLGFEDFGWEVIPFLEPLYVEGVTFQHYFTSGLMDRPISGENIGLSILRKYHSSCFQGHTHLLQLFNQADAFGRLQWAGSVGCYFEHIEEWQSKQAQNHFWRGLVMLHNVDNGFIEEISSIPISRIKKEYR